MENYHVIEQNLRDLVTRRAILEQRTQQRLATLNDFVEILRKSNVKRTSAVKAKNEEASLRNRALLNEVSRNLVLFSKRVSDIENSCTPTALNLLHAKQAYYKQLEDKQPMLLKINALRLEDETRRLKIEKDLAMERRAKLKEEIQNEAIIKLELEKQRRDLLLTLAAEQNDILEANAYSVLLAQESDKINELVASQISETNERVQQLMTSGMVALSKTSQLHSENTSRIAQLGLEANKIKPKRPAVEPQYSAHQAADARVIDTLVPRLVSVAAEQTVNQSSFETPTVLQHSSTTPRVLNQREVTLSTDTVNSLMGVTVEDSLATATPRDSIISLSRQSSQQKVAVPSSASKVALTSSSSAVTIDDDSQLAGVLVQSRNADDLAKPKNPVSTPAQRPQQAIAIAATPAHMKRVASDMLPSSPSHAIRRSNSEGSGSMARASQAMGDTKIIEQRSGASAAQTTSPSHVIPASAQKQHRHDASDEFDLSLNDNSTLTADQSLLFDVGKNVCSSGKPENKEDLLSFSKLQQQLSSMSPQEVCKSLKSVCAALENNLSFSIGGSTSVKDIYELQFAASIRVYGAEVVRYLECMQDSDLVSLEHYNSNNAVLGRVVMALVQSVSKLLMPMEAFSGVVTIEKLKKEYKKPGQAGALDLWNALVTHLQRIVALNEAYLNHLSMCFTTILVSHVPADDSERFVRKASQLLQIALIPPQTDGPRSPSPPYRSRSTPDSEVPAPPKAPSQDVVRSSTMNSATSSRPVSVNASDSQKPPAAPHIGKSKSQTGFSLSGKSFGAMSFDYLQVPSKSAAELDDDEILADEVLQRPPPIKNLDELHGGLNSISSAQASRSASQQAAKQKSTNWAKSGQAEDDEFDF